VACTCHFSYLRRVNRKITVQSGPSITQDHTSKIIKAKRAGSVVQGVKHLQVFEFKPHITPKKKSFLRSTT
jgi:hypothetical protein